MSKLLILGAGGHGRVAAECAMLMKKWQGISFLDDAFISGSFADIPVIGRLGDYEFLKDDYSSAFVAIGDSSLRLNYIESLVAAGFEVPVLIHPGSIISEYTQILEGSCVLAGAVVTVNARLGRGCIVNTSATVDHDCILSDGVHISPGAHIAGDVKIGSGSWICTGALVINGIEIGSSCVVAAGSTVIENIGDNSFAAGSPAVIKKKI